MSAMLIRHEPAGASAARREIAHDLELRGVSDEVIDDVTLVASELIGNAVRHTAIVDRGELDVNWNVERDAVIVSVEDPSFELPVVRRVGSEAASGRGLAIVEALASDWGFERTRRGKRVWAKVQTRRAS